MKLDIGLGPRDRPGCRSPGADRRDGLLRGEAQEVRLVAEGIETQAELETLRSLGVSYGQGYLLGRPQDEQDPGALACRPSPSRILLPADCRARWIGSRVGPWRKHPVALPRRSLDGAQRRITPGQVVRQVELEREVRRISSRSSPGTGWKSSVATLITMPERGSGTSRVFP